MTIQTQCGGTLIHPEWVVSAAHCFFDKHDAIQTNFEHLPSESTADFKVYKYNYPEGLSGVLQESLFWSFGRSRKRGFSKQAAGMAIERLYIVPYYDNSQTTDLRNARGDIAVIKLAGAVEGIDPVPPVSGSYRYLYSLGFGRKEIRSRKGFIGPRVSSLDPSSKAKTFSKSSNHMRIGRHGPATCGSGQVLGPFWYSQWYMCTIGTEWEQENGSMLQMAVDQGDSGGPIFSMPSSVTMDEVVVSKSTQPVRGVELLGVLSVVLVDRKRSIASNDNGAAWTDLRSASSPARHFVSDVLKANSVDDTLGWVLKSSGAEEHPVESLADWSTMFKKVQPRKQQSEETETASLSSSEPEAHSDNQEGTYTIAEGEEGEETETDSGDEKPRRRDTEEQPKAKRPHHERDGKDGKTDKDPKNDDLPKSHRRKSSGHGDGHDPNHDPKHSKKKDDLPKPGHRRGRNGPPAAPGRDGDDREGSGGRS